MAIHVAISFVCGMAVALFGAYLLFGAQHRMVSSSDAFQPRVYYVVGEKRFDFFGKTGKNCLGGRTLDGRCISAVYIFEGSSVKNGARTVPQRNSSLWPVDSPARVQ